MKAARPPTEAPYCAPQCAAPAPNPHVFAHTLAHTQSPPLHTPPPHTHTAVVSFLIFPLHTQSPPPPPPPPPPLAVVSFLVFPVRARGLLQKKMASTLIRVGDLGVWLMGQVGRGASGRESRGRGTGGGMSRWRGASGGNS